jgi:hypothetical protein
MDGGVAGTVVGGILGFLASLIPEIFAFLRERRGLPTDTTAGTNGSVVAEGELDEAGVPATYYDPSKQADRRIAYTPLDVLRSSVRPVITYVFFGAFIGLKLMSMHHAIWYDHTKVVDILPIIWDEGTEALFALVLAFWFGSRAIAHIRRK